MTDLAVVDPAAALAAAADPAEFVVQCLERGKTWLTEALTHGDLDTMVNVKGYAATLRTATMQKQLGKDAELAATELVRRAERCIGLGIRAGQQDGSVNSHGSNLNKHAGADRSPGYAPRPVTDFATRGELHGDRIDGTGIYDLTDDVTDDDFERALSQARDEGNMSRANIGRHANPAKAKTKKPKDRDEYHRGTRRLDPARIIEETINSLEGLAIGLSLLETADYAALDASKRLEWLEALNQSLSAITRLKRGLSR